jgi:cytochrome c556
MMRRDWTKRTLLACLAATLAMAACQRKAPESAADAQPVYAPTATIKDLMLGLIDPAADAVWLAVTTVVGAAGTVDTAPQTDEDWNKVRYGAMTLVEGANLLLMPGRHVAEPGEKSVTPGVELEPEEMQALIDKDRAAWNARAQQLRAAGVAVLVAVKARDADKVFELGAEVEEACESCHRQYWYPNEKLPYDQPAAP